MALTNIPLMWAAAILSKLPTAHVFGAPGVVNRDYEGLIRNAGDSVKIVGLNDPTIFDYTKNTDLPAPETLTDTDQTLTIDQAKAFFYQLDDIDRVQTFPKVDQEAAGRAAYQLVDAADLFLAATMAAGVASGNTIGSTAAPINVAKDTDPGDPSGTPAVPATTGLYEVLVQLGIKLDKANVPSAGRWVVLPPFAEGILTTDLRFIGEQGVSGTAGTVLSDGRIGRAAGFDVLKSNNVPVSSGKYSILAGHALATSFAEQIVRVEMLRLQTRFGDGMRGLHVYGGKVVRPDVLAKAIVTDGSGLDA